MTTPSSWRVRQIRGLREISRTNVYVYEESLKLTILETLSISWEVGRLRVRHGAAWWIIENGWHLRRHALHVPVRPDGDEVDADAPTSHDIAFALSGKSFHA